MGLIVLLLAAVLVFGGLLNDLNSIGDILALLGAT